MFTGRGSEDDKGNSLAALFALAAVGGAVDGGLAALPVRFIVAIEGEEEVGSPGFAQVLDAQRDFFGGATMVLSADGNQPSRERGSLLLSLRGLLAAQIDLARDSPEGVDPNVALSRIVASLHDPATNRVAVEGFYEGVRELPPEERAALGRVDDAEEAAALGVRAMVGEAGYTTAERRSIRPTLEVVGAWGDERAAHAKLAMRLVGAQDPSAVFEALERHLAEVAPALAGGVTAALLRLNEGAPAVAVDRGFLGIRVAGEVLDEVYGEAHATHRSGGSNNMISYFHQRLGLSTVELGFGSHDDFVHAPNERWRVEDLHLSLRVWVRMFVRLVAELAPGSFDSGPPGGGATAPLFSEEL